MSYYIFGLEDPEALAQAVLVKNLYFTRDIMINTFIIIILLQLPGVLLANNRALRVKPMIAMQAL